MLELLQVMGFTPRYATWELTLACTMHCRYCSSSAGQPRHDELTSREALCLCADLAEAGCTVVTLSGGEPLQREDWPLIAKALSDRGVIVKMISNGELFSRSVAGKALEAGLKDMCFSIDGLEESHTYLRQAPGNWRKILENFRICREMDMMIRAITVVNRRNLDELQDLQKILAECGVQDWKIQLCLPVGNSRDHKDLLLKPQDLLNLLPLIRKLVGLESPRVNAAHNLGYYGYGFEENMRSDPEDDTILWIGCTAGCQEVGIESNGTIKGCCNLPSESPFLEGNVRDHSFRQIWDNPEGFSYNRKFRFQDLTGFCRACDYRVVCRGGCVWAALAHSGTRNETPYCYRRLLLESR